MKVLGHYEHKIMQEDERYQEFLTWIDEEHLLLGNMKEMTLGVKNRVDVVVYKLNPDGERYCYRGTSDVAIDWVDVTENPPPDWIWGYARTE